MMIKSPFQTLPLFALLQHQGFPFLQGGQWVKEGPTSVPGPPKMLEVRWGEWGRGRVLRSTVISAPWLSFVENPEVERTEGDALVFGKHRVSLVAGYVASYCVCFFLKKFF